MPVYLVGAGPGDPGLLTVRGAEVLALADVVVYDRLLDPVLLSLAPAAAERFDVGKSPGGPVRQEEINALLIERGKAGLNVVRLKGGDPFVLGRGGEEAMALAAAGVEFEVVPGVTSAVAVPAYAGIPVTHRGLAASFVVVTGHSRHGAEVEPDWDALARSGATIVVLMGVAHRAEIAARLMAGGLAAETPAAAISKGTFAGQRTVRTTLGGLGDAAVEPTSVLVIGAVAGLDLAWFERRPLLGCTVVVTRAATQAGETVAALRAAGAATIEAPVIEVVAPADGAAALREAASRLGAYDWVAFTSANGAAAVFDVIRDARAFGAARVAAVGPATAATLDRHGVRADLVPESSTSSELAQSMVATGGAGKVLLVQAEQARRDAAAILRDAGWTVDEVTAYRTVPVVPSAEVLAQVASADVVTFTSPSTVDAFVDAVGAAGVPPTVACIGPVTAEAARARGLTVDVVAEASTTAGLVDALVAAVGSKP